MSLSIRDFFAGWGAGICGLLVGHPADTIKVRQQVHKRTGISKILITTIRQEGVLALYRGMLSPLLLAGFQNSVFFGVYGNTVRLFQKYQGADITRRTCGEGSIHNRYWHCNVYLAGVIAAFIHGFIACPVDLIKIKLQATIIQDHNAYYLKDCIKKIYLTSGICGFYHGLLPTLIRDVPICGFYVLLYEHLLSIGRAKSDRSSQYSVFSQIISGGLAGSLTWVAVTPLDVIKSRIQADHITNPKYNGIVDCAMKSYKEDGLLVFGRGFWIHIIRGFPVNAATFVGYEWFLKMYRFLDT